MRIPELIRYLKEMAKRLNIQLRYYDPFGDLDHCMVEFRDSEGEVLGIHKIYRYADLTSVANKIEASLLDKLKTGGVKMDILVTGWRPISEYSRDEYDWVLIKCFDGSFECIPEVAEMRVDGKWYNQAGTAIPDILEVKYFFDMQQLDKKGENQ